MTIHFKYKKDLMYIKKKKDFGILENRKNIRKCPLFLNKQFLINTNYKIPYKNIEIEDRTKDFTQSQSRINLSNYQT